MIRSTPKSTDSTAKKMTKLRYTRAMIADHSERWICTSLRSLAS